MKADLRQFAVAGALLVALYVPGAAFAQK